MYAKTSLTAHKINTQNAKFTKILLVCRSIKITPTVRYWHSFYSLGVSFFSSLTFSKGSNLCWNAMLKKTFASKILMLFHTFFWESTLESWPMIRNAPMEMKSKHHRWKIFRNVYLAFMALEKCTRKKKNSHPWEFLLTGSANRYRSVVLCGFILWWKFHSKFTFIGWWSK